VKYADGGNHSFELREGLAYCRVWQRPDVDSATGAKWAREMIGHFEQLALASRGIVVDLTDAPPVNGPRTQDALGRMLHSFERARRPVAIVVGPNAMQRLQLQRIIEDEAPTQAKLFDSESTATHWILTQGRGRPSAR
jgi:hypothetical protein